MKYNVNNTTVEITRKAAHIEVKATRRHGADGLIHFDKMDGYKIDTNIDGLDLTTYKLPDGYWFVLDAISGIAVSQAYTYKKAIERIIDLLTNNGIVTAVNMIKEGREACAAKWAKYIAAE